MRQGLFLMAAFLAAPSLMMGQNVDWKLTGSYQEKSVTWTPADVAKLPHVKVSVHNGHLNTDETYSGVELSTLLAALGTPAKLHGEALALYVKAYGADGYKVVLSLPEVTSSFRVHPDEQVIVADERNGKPDADSGPLQLIVTGDKMPARWVHGLVAIKVLPAE